MLELYQSRNPLTETNRRREIGVEQLPQIESIAEMSDIQSVVRQIVNQFQPEKVILFGSYAYGKPSEDSDVDLLVVMDCEKRPIRVAAEISAAVDHAFPLDILVRKPDEFQESFERGGNFATEVLTEGHVLYEA
tara:strand:+ start:126 stop:527 length:402 start_codon:yes stop_codon:yes gene_type:complete